MLTADGCKARRQRLWNAASAPFDRALIHDPKHLVYFANYYPTPFLFRSVDAGAILVIDADGRATLIADSSLKAYAETAFVDEALCPKWYDGAHAAPHREASLVANALDFLGKGKGKRVGVEMGKLPAGVALSLQNAGYSFVDLDQTIRDLKRRKDEDEIALLGRAARAAEAGHLAARERLRPGMTELQAFLLIQSAANEAAGEQCLVYGDFSSGPRCETKGGAPTDRVIQAGDLFLIDYSVMMRLYRCDFANTFVVGGKPTAEQLDMRAACLSAMAAAETAAQVAAEGKEVDRAARLAFAQLGYEEYFLHHTGHGVGLSHPEPPFLAKESTDLLVAGDVITIEPGLYKPGVAGMRFEHNYAVREDRLERITKHELTLEPA